MVGEIGPGLCVLVGFAAGDGGEEAARLARKLAALRIFEDESGRMNFDVRAVGGSALVVSQFTLVAETAKGNRPSFGRAALPDEAESLYAGFCEALAAEGVRVARGVFGARMEVELVNDGPVTIILET